MAIYHFSVSNINRTSQSAVAAAAYRSGEKLNSERDGKVKNYKERDVQPDGFILSPKHAPAWTQDRETLWNKVEEKETNINARLAREITIALPKELNEKEQKEALMEYCKENFSDKGMVADVNIHRDKEENPHAHVMLTTRSFKENGEWDLKKKRELLINKDGSPKLNDAGEKQYKFKSLTDWNSTQTLINWRENFANKMNEAFKKKGLDITVSHKSYKDLGIDKVPTVHLGHKANGLENKAKMEASKQGKEYVPVTEKGKLNAEIKEHNKAVNELEEFKKRKSERELSSSQNTTVVEPTNLSEMDNFRKAFRASNEKYENVKHSYKLIENRIKDTISANKINELDVSISKWKTSISIKDKQLQTMKDNLNKASHMYKKNDMDAVKYYGFTPDKFNDEFREKVKEYKEELTKQDAKKEKVNQLESAFDDVIEVEEQVDIAIIKDHISKDENYKNVSMDSGDQSSYIEDALKKYNPTQREELIEKIKVNKEPIDLTSQTMDQKIDVQRSRELRDYAKKKMQDYVVIDRTYKDAIRQSNEAKEKKASPNIIKDYEKTVVDLKEKRDAKQQDMRDANTLIKKDVLSTFPPNDRKGSETLHRQMALLNRKEIDKLHEVRCLDDNLKGYSSLSERNYHTSLEEDGEKLGIGIVDRKEIWNEKYDSKYKNSEQTKEKNSKGSSKSLSGALAETLNNNDNQQKKNKDDIQKKKKKRGRNTQERHMDM